MCHRLRPVPQSFRANLQLRPPETSVFAGDFILNLSYYMSLEYRYDVIISRKKIYCFRFVKSRSAARIAALATKLLMLLRSRSAAWSTSLRSASVKYTRIFLSRVCRDLRRDLGAGLFFMAKMVHRRNGEPNVASGSCASR